MVDLSNFISNKKILSDVVTLDYNKFVVKFCQKKKLLYHFSIKYF